MRGSENNIFSHKPRVLYKYNFGKIWLMLQVSIILNLNTKHLMTGPKGNSEFCFPKTLNVGLRGNKTHYFPWGQSLSVLLYLPTQK